MNTSKRIHSRITTSAVIAFAGLAIAPAARAQMISNTAATWASNNNVVSLAPGSSLAIAAFKSEIESAFTGGTGGTINFEGATTGNHTSIVSSFNGGASSITFTVTGNSVNTATDATNSASGSTYMGFLNNVNGTAYTFTPSEPLSVFGIVAITRGSVRTPTITLNLANSSTVALTDAIAVSADNTLFNYKSISASTNIVSFSITMPDGFARFDDIGFVTASAVPEPSTYAALVGAGILAFAATRRRRS